jgi:hypothetical protein
LDLAYNPIGADGAKAITEVLKFHGNINTLKLGWCQVNLSYEPLSVYLNNFFLTVQHGIILQLGVKGAEAVADMLRYNTTISILDLRANGLKNEVRSFR